MPLCKAHRLVKERNRKTQQKQASKLDMREFHKSDMAQSKRLLKQPPWRIFFRLRISMAPKWEHQARALLPAAPRFSGRDVSTRKP